MKLFSVSVHLSGFNALYDPVSSCVCEHTDSEHILFLLLKGLQQQQVVLQNANSKNQEKENWRLLSHHQQWINTKNGIRPET